VLLQEQVLRLEASELSCAVVGIEQTAKRDSREYRQERAFQQQIRESTVEPYQHLGGEVVEQLL
jgi:hypothetical protein